MSLPTAAPVPVLVNQNKIVDWARELVNYLSSHISIFAWPEARLLLNNGANHNVDPKTGSMLHITGPTGAFNITGFAKASSGRQLIVHNDSLGTMTLTNNSGLSAIGNRILTYGGDIVTTIAVLIWDQQALSWLVVSRNP